MAATAACLPLCKVAAVPSVILVKNRKAVPRTLYARCSGRTIFSVKTKVCKWDRRLPIASSESKDSISAADSVWHAWLTRWTGKAGLPWAIGNAGGESSGLWSWSLRWPLRRSNAKERLHAPSSLACLREVAPLYLSYSANAFVPATCNKLETQHKSLLIWL